MTLVSQAPSSEMILGIIDSEEDVGRVSSWAALYMRVQAVRLLSLCVTNRKSQQLAAANSVSRRPKLTGRL